MNITLTTTLSPSGYEFLTRYAERSKKPKNAIIEAGLNLLQQQSLEEEVARGFISRKGEYTDLSRTLSPVQIASLHD